jgi:hypothetical protein
MGKKNEKNTPSPVPPRGEREWKINAVVGPAHVQHARAVKNRSPGLELTLACRIDISFA